MRLKMDKNFNIKTTFYNIIKLNNMYNNFLKSNFLILNTIKFNDIFLLFYHDAINFIIGLICIGFFSLLYIQIKFQSFPVLKFNFISTIIIININKLFIWFYNENKNQDEDEDEDKNKLGNLLDQNLDYSPVPPKPPKKPFPNELIDFAWIFKELMDRGVDLDKLFDMGWTYENIKKVIFDLNVGFDRFEKMIALKWSYSNFHLLNFSTNIDFVKFLIDCGLTNYQINMFLLIYGITITIIILIMLFSGSGGPGSGVD